MIFKTPLGFIALIAIIILLLIYLIKPTYQNKVIASTYIWRTSLKFKKNRKPTSKLLNIFTIIVEILIILNISLILASAVILTGSNDRSKQEIMIIDSSYSMSAGIDSTRLERAKRLAKENAKKSIDDNKKVSIINLNKEASFIVNKELDLNIINRAIDNIEPTYYGNDIEAAMRLTNEALKENPLSEVSLYTDKDYKNSGDVAIYNLKKDGEWNTAILNAKSESIDNFYEFYVDVITYGANKYVNVNLKLLGVNETNKSLEFKQRINTKDSILTRARFKDLGVYSYEGCEITISPDGGGDYLTMDNFYYLPRSYKDNIKIQYYSAKPNNFFQGVLNTLTNKYSSYFDVSIVSPQEEAGALNSGFDFYIYEHTAPATIPTDGATLIVNPDTLPRGIGANVMDEVKGDFSFKKGITSEITRNMDIERIESVMYKPISINEDYTSLIKYNNDNVLVSNEKLRLVILSLNLNMSNLPLLMEFPILINNIFGSYIKPIISKSTYVVGEEIELNTRGKAVSIKLDDETIRLDKGGKIAIAKPGVYKATEILLDNTKSHQELFVRLDRLELDDTTFINNDPSLFKLTKVEANGLDIYLYLSISLLMLVLLDRFLRRSKSI